MNNIWQDPPELRLKEWRKFRKQLEELEDTECLQQLTEWWSYAPMSARVIDPYDNEHWPDPWKLLFNGEYDENIISLGICYTLELMDWENTLMLVQHRKKGTLGLVVCVDNEYVLGYNHNTVDDAEILQEFEILKKWESSELT